MTTWFDRLKSGLKKTRAGLADSLASALRGRKTLTAADLEELEEILISGDVGANLSASLVAELRDAAKKDSRDPLDVLKSILVARLAESDRPLRLRADGAPTVVLVAGVNGAGKTTTIAKIAAHLREERPTLPMTFAAADTFRAAAVEQLAVWSERIGADLIRHQEGADPSAVVFDALDHVERKGGVLLIDTAGRLQTKHNLMEELRKIERTVVRKLNRPSDERLLVLDATTGQNGIAQAECFHAAIELTGLVLTKLDGTAKGGVTFSIRESLGLPILFVGVGESAEDLHAFSAEEFVEALFAE
ncbi:MAG: signal recognition particle-docking protein FtsY [Candidatus Bipolaricaulota bacterium]|nr:signal recognition particle-docking protein FtsY [Candidatus Bipolaricaulota bacterium]